MINPSYNPELHSSYNRGASRIFSRGVEIFKKKFKNYVDLFFRATKLIFRALPKHFKDPVLAKISLSQEFSKNRTKRHFLENVYQKIAFSGARSPLKISIYWRQRWTSSQNSTKRGPFGSSE